MSFVDHLIGQQPENKLLEVAFGRHVVAGDLAKSIVSGASPGHIVTIQQILGETFGFGWAGPLGVWFNGVNRPSNRYQFHTGANDPDPVKKNFTADSATDVLTSTAHGFSNGDMVLFSGNDLPRPLAPNRIYWVRDTTTNTFQVALTNGGAAIDLTTNGSGTREVWFNSPATGVDAVFDRDTPHSGTAWLRCDCPSGSEVGIPPADTKANPPVGLTCVIDCQKGPIYDEEGTIVNSSSLLLNPADVIAFACMHIQGFPLERIDWESLQILRDHCNEVVTPDYATLPIGVGLTGEYYSGTNFNTLVSTRTDPVVQFDLSSGAPELGLDPDSFSVRWEGQIRPRYSELYTFYCRHDNGGRVWVNGTQIINEWGTVGEHSGTISLSADQFYDIKAEWFESGVTAEFRLDWESASQTRQVIPQDRLYPKNLSMPRYESHVAITERTTLDGLLRQVLLNCNGLYQDRNGKLTFFTLDDLTPAFAFDETLIVKNSFKFYPRYSQLELLTLPNRFQAVGRDLDSRYLQAFDPPCYFDVPSLQTIAGRVITEQVPLGNCRRWQAFSNLEAFAKLRTSNLICEFTGMPGTLAVLPGDVVTVSHSIPAWDNKQFLVLEASDVSLDSQSAERIFRLMEW